MIVKCCECGWTSELETAPPGGFVKCANCGAPVSVPQADDEDPLQDSELEQESLPREHIKRKSQMRKSRPRREKEAATGAKKEPAKEPGRRPSEKRKPAKPRKSIARPIGLSLAGGVLGVILVRFLLLDPVQVFGWQLFWDGLFEGHLMDVEFVLKSVTFAKCALGFVIGAVGVEYASNLAVGAKGSSRTPVRIAELVVMCICAVLLAALTIVPGQKPDRSDSAGEEEEFGSGTPRTVNRATPGAISGDYERSQQDGNEKYAGRVWEVEGIIDSAYAMDSLPEEVAGRWSTIVGASGGYFVEFESGSWQAHGVICHFRRGAVPPGQKGKSVVIRGTCVGLVLQSAVVFRDCEYVK